MGQILKEAKRLHTFGFAVLWLHPKSKRPIGDGWASGPRKSWEQLSKEYREGMNVGVRLGIPSKMQDGFLAAIDCDVKSKEARHLKEMRDSLKKLLRGKELPRVSSGRRNGSAHQYCRTRKAFKTFTPYRSKELVEYQSPTKTPSKKEVTILGPAKIAKGIRLGPAWEISLYSDGRQCVLPPSIHPDTGREYRWEIGVHSAGDIPLLKFDLPDQEVQDDKTESKSTKTADSKFSFTPEEIDVSWLPGISNEVRDGILTGDGVDDRSEFLLKATSALHSVGLNQNQIISALTDPAHYISSCAFDHAQTKKRERAAYWLWKYTVRKVLLERPGNVAFDDAPKSASKKLSKKARKKQDAEMTAMTSWKDDLEKSTHGNIKSTLGNLDLIFSNCTKEKLFIMDTFAGRIYYGCASQWGKERGSQVTDLDYTLIKHWLGKKYGFEPNTNLILEGVVLVAHRNGFHPVQDRLKSLVWDGVPRIGTWLKDYCMAEAPEPYLTDVSKMFLVAMVTRVFEPGCQWDYILIMEGKQGYFKSSIARALSGDDKWFLENMPDFKDKDAVVYLQGKWLVELAELANVKRSDYSSAKAFFTRRIDTIRLPYAKTREDVPRQNIFIGTVNEDQYLKDPTGNRRYLPIKVGLCDVVGIRENWEQLFAEAYAVYKEGTEKLYLEGETLKQAVAAQEDRQVDDENSDMKELLLEFFKTDEGKEILSRRFKIRELFEGVNCPWGPYNGKYFAQQNGSQLLLKMGFEKKPVNGQRWYRVPKGMYLNGGAELERSISAKKRSTGSTTKQIPDFY